MSNYVDFNDVMRSLYARGVSVGCVTLQGDVDYFAVSKEEVLACAPVYTATLELWGQQKWRPVHDCENKAQLYKCVVDGSYAAGVPKELENDVPQSAAFFEIRYTASRIGRHSINMACVQPDCNIEFFEPQQQRFITLTDDEVASITSVYS